LKMAKEPNGGYKSGYNQLTKNVDTNTTRGNTLWYTLHYKG